MSPRASDDEQALWGWLASVAHTQSPVEIPLGLARVIVAQSGAERAWIAGIDETGDLADAWGADLDGLELGQAQQRIDANLLRAALASDGPLYQREVETKGGRGSRLAMAAREPCGGQAALRAVILVEHRFHCGRFDSVTPSQAARWTTLAALALRLSAEGERRNAPAPPEWVQPGPDRVRGPSHAEPTTILPVLEPRRSFPDILGESPALRRALARLDAAIDAELPVLITGETGTGKELFARALHELGSRSRRELVAINCGALPDALFEAELFGHARGSFTGAERARPGLLARAEGGTLLLDELGELPLPLQAALLRTLESRRYRPVGSDEERPFDVRIVAATNSDLEQAVAGKTFRQDLLFRVNAIEIHVPPLRDRAGDIAGLAHTFLKRAGSSAEIAPATMRALVSYEWPGNVRELMHQMQRLAVLDVPQIDLGHLPRLIRTPPASRPPEPSPISSNEPPPEDERERTQRVLTETRGNISHAAAVLGITRHGLKKRMVRLGIRPAASSVDKPS